MIGVLNVCKPSGLSSNKVVIHIKKILNLKKVGHLGTLDPMASGVLPICIGKATRLFDYFLNKTKTYIAEFSFGYETTTFDLEGEITNKTQKIVTKSELERAIKKNFLGKISQMPPLYSAKKVNGKKAYEVARKGGEIVLKEKEVEIFEFEILEEVKKNKFLFKITCSSGTFIRSLARDLGRSVGNFCTMTKLTRIRCGNFDIKDSIDFKDLTFENIEKNIIEIDKVVDLEELVVTQEEYEKLRNGIKLNNFCGKIGLYKVKVNGEVVGIGEIDGGLKIKTYLV